MEEQPATVQGKSLDSPDETRQFVDKGKADIVHLGNVSVGRFVWGAPQACAEPIFSRTAANPTRRHATAPSV